LEQRGPELTAFIDGASLGNPGPAGAGALLRSPSGEEVKALSAYLGETTNNVAEYQALILALENAAQMGVRRLAVFSDSELLVKQFNGEYRVKNAGLKPFFQRAKELAEGFTQLSIRHIPREENARADELARQAAERRDAPQSQSRLEQKSARLVKGALSLNDVSLLPVWSDVLPEQVRTDVLLAGGVRLNIPLLISLADSGELVSFAAVTALRGGLAILRPARSAREQIAAIREIKALPGDGKNQSEKNENQALASRDERNRIRVGVLVHPGDDLLDVIGMMGEAGVDLVLLEASLGHGPELIEGIARIKERWPHLPLIGGDVTDANGACRALEAGADGVKVGAPYLLGLKVPLFSAIQECSAVAGERGAVLVADVGTTELMMASSRVARAIGAGAHVAMATLEFSSGDWQPQTLAESLDNLRDDLRMIMSCCGVRTIQELRQGARFVRVRDAADSF